jgi:hypothetical protein
MIDRFHPGTGNMEQYWLRKADAYLGYGFSPEAQGHFDEWYTALQNRLRDGSLPHDALVAHLAKYGSLMAKLALVFHVIDNADGNIQGDGQYAIQAGNALRAIAWCEYLESHAFHLYGSEKNGVQMDTIEKLLEKMKSGALGTEFAVWELLQKGWSGLKDSKRVHQALSSLEELGWVRLQRSQDTGGRPSEKALIHPCIREIDPKDGAGDTYPAAWLEKLRGYLKDPDRVMPDTGLFDREEPGHGLWDTASEADVSII